MMGHKVTEKVKERMKFLNKGKFGRKHPCWIDEKKNPLHKAVRQSGKTDIWRIQIFKRDKFSCVLCNSKNIIQADHFPKGFAEIMKENNIKTYEEALSCKILWNINNGRTLCLECHKKTPNYLKKPKSLN